MFFYLLLFFALLFYIYYKLKFSFWSSRGISGPTPWPIVGTVIKENWPITGKEIELEFFKKYGLIYGTYAGTLPVFNTGVPEHIKHVLMNPEIFNQSAIFVSNDDYLRHAIFFNNGEKWKSDRTAMSHHFTSGKLRNLLHYFKGVTQNFLDNVEELTKEDRNQAINTKPIFKWPKHALIVPLSTTSYGIDCISKFIFAIDVNSFKDQSEWTKLAKVVGDPNIFQALCQFFLPKWLGRMLGLNFFKIEPTNRLGAMFKKMLRERKLTGLRYNDLSEMLDDAIDKGLNMDEDTKLGNCLLGFFGGVETISNGLCQIAEYLVEYPDIQERLYQELKNDFSEEITYEKLTQHAYLDAFFNEAFRLGTAVYTMLKNAAVDTHLGEYRIPKGTEIGLLVYVNHINPENFPEPMKFDPNRFLDKSPENPNRIDAGTYLPFSQGKRACIGKLLASLEIKYLITVVLLKYKLKKPPGFKVASDSFRGGVTFRNVPVIFERRE